MTAFRGSPYRSSSLGSSMPTRSPFGLAAPRRAGKLVGISSGRPRVPPSNPRKSVGLPLWLSRSRKVAWVSKPSLSEVLKKNSDGIWRVSIQTEPDRKSVVEGKRVDVGESGGTEKKKKSVM